MTPPVRGNQHQHHFEDAELAAKDPPPILEKHLEHVFLTFADGRGNRLYALEFLAAMVVTSRAIWDFHEKMTLLLELFHDPATSSSKAMAYASAQRLKETDVARMLLCVMNGVGRATQGVARVWQTHELRVSSFARQSAFHCMQSIVSSRLETPASALGPSTTKSVSSEELRVYVAATPALHQFLALFSGEELRNPLTFEPTASHFSRQTELPLGDGDAHCMTPDAAPKTESYNGTNPQHSFKTSSSTDALRENSKLEPRLSELRLTAVYLLLAPVLALG
ncbi:putative regulator of chromosome condensation (RCC1) [Phytophthora cinnamomi]|uniref:putative regulator of chromosome condensation (RCC1) n=1 Tax=Phytophthora cinnamomi TaxID=4785 RepID=UPI0035594910|nr:putative regulator of chromosome condensation (RCC1) [Phytophthora cinnamomi]